MSPEQFVAILFALAAVFGAVAKCIAEVRQYHSAVNSKMDALLTLTAASSRAEGVLAEREAQEQPPGLPGGRSPLPSENWRQRGS
jgi:hypothetical protein